MIRLRGKIVAETTKRNYKIHVEHLSSDIQFGETTKRNYKIQVMDRIIQLAN